MLTPKEQDLANGLWYLTNMARTHDSIAAVLARYHELEAENARLNEACDRIARAGMHESDERG